MEILSQYGEYIFYLLLIILFIKSIFSLKIEEHHSHWNTLIDNFNFSSKEFYVLLKQELNKQGVTGIEIDNVRLKEGNIFSPRRWYLRATWKEYQYDICAAPFGKGFFLSWWLLYKSSIIQILVSKIPIIGFWLQKTFFPITYYKNDTAAMFMSYAQQSVLNVLDNISITKGVRMLNTDERKPILNNVFKR